MLKHVKPGKKRPKDSEESTSSESESSFKDPLGRRKQSASVKRRLSIQQEERLSARGGGRRVPGSGAFGGHLTGDVQLKDWLIEAKRTEGDSYRITKEVVHKAYLEALLAKQRFALALEVYGMKDDLLPHRFVLMTEDDFFQLINKGVDDEQE